MTSTPDPLIHCDLYREHGCTHLDGFLCDVRSCTMLQAFKQPTKETPTMNTPSQQPLPEETATSLNTKNIYSAKLKEALFSLFTRYKGTPPETKDPEVKTPDVFLGGTCAGTTWRTELTALIKDPSVLFNPVCPPGVEWNEAWRDKENEAKEQCGCHVYVLTPQMEGVYSIAELTADAVNDYLHTFFVILDTDSSPATTTITWNPNQRKSLEAEACVDLWLSKGAEQFHSLEALALRINDLYCETDKPWKKTW